MRSNNGPKNNVKWNKYKAINKLIATKTKQATICVEVDVIQSSDIKKFYGYAKKIGINYKARNGDHPKSNG